MTGPSLPVSPYGYIQVPVVRKQWQEQVSYLLLEGHCPVGFYPSATPSPRDLFSLSSFLTSQSKWKEITIKSSHEEVIMKAIYPNRGLGNSGKVQRKKESILLKKHALQDLNDLFLNSSLS